MVLDVSQIEILSPFTHMVLAVCVNGKTCLLKYGGFLKYRAIYN